MRGKRAFSVAKKDIVNHFDSLEKTVFKLTDIEEILRSHSSHWRLINSLTAKEFIELLIAYTPLKKWEFEERTETIRRYSWKEDDPYILALSIHPKSFFSHYTAMYLHNLTEQIPKSIYVSRELSIKETKSTLLEQKNIDIAFSKSQRMPDFHNEINKYKIFLLNSQNSLMLGVEEMIINSRKIFVTSLERTLIDITVRPSYSGGIQEILKAYENAKKSISVNKLVAILSRMNFIYPYHQSIGFLLQKAGYRDTQIALLKQFEIKYDFYLDYEIKNKKFSKEWRLYYPETIKE